MAFDGFALRDLLTRFAPLSESQPLLSASHYILQLACCIVMLVRRLLFAIMHATVLLSAAPPGFPSSGNGLWFNTTGDVWAKTYLPIGNGYLAAMTPGGTTVEITQLNIESLWTGGPFADPTYNGGNMQPSQAATAAGAMQSYRAGIFTSATGTISDISSLMSPVGDYGSYAGAGYLITILDDNGPETDFGRWLDLDEGVARTTWSRDNISFLRETFCSHPTQACTQYLSSKNDAILPSVTYAFSSAIEGGLPTPNITCLDSKTLQVRGFAGVPGMLYEILGQVYSTTGDISCQALSSANPPNATISVTGATEVWISWVGGTEYSMDAGNAASNFSFRGADPHDVLVSVLSSSTHSYNETLATHVADYKATMSERFSLSLGQTPRLDVPTDQLRAAYEVDSGDPYLEWLAFNLGRHLLVSSARGTLPANLQGKWALGVSNPWGADYHSNINIQMNYWSAEMSNLNVTHSLFDYFEKTWAPRGAETAQLTYNISRGWVTHNEMNIFGHTGMKQGDAQWANYPESAVWMMIHVWDHFDYTNDVRWWQAQGWPLLKGVASFHLDKLIPDLRFNDSSLVVVPCNSPEQVPITLGCAHAQQLIWQMFNAVEKGFDASGDDDVDFLQEVRTKRALMDKGLHIGSWGQLQEWKVDMDSPTDTHRHLSHLIGLYPGYAVSNYDAMLQGSGSTVSSLVNGTNTASTNASTSPRVGVTYTKDEIMEAAKTSLIHRGNGTGPDADAGWEKAWRAAAWAQFGDDEMFYHELTYTIYEDFGPNLFSLYNPSDPDPIFQIDANLGLPGAVLNALLQAPDVPNFTTPLVITLLPALPRTWPSGSIKGARVRGGITVDLEWKDRIPTLAVFNVDADPVSTQRVVWVLFGGQKVGEFGTKAGEVVRLSRF